MSRIKRPSEIAGESEGSQQAALFQFISVAKNHGYGAAWAFDQAGEMPKFEGESLPELRWIHAIPNGSVMGASSDKTGRAIRAMRMKMEGLTPGVPDIFFPFPSSGYHGLYIEMKRGKGGKLRDEQKAFISYAESVGYRCVVCKSWDEAAMELEAYHANHVG